MSIKGFKDTKLFIGGALSADADQTAYEALTWVEVKELASIGEFGAEESMNTFSPLSGTDRKFKGNVNAGDPAIEYAYIADDAGQVALRAAGDDKQGSYAFKIELNDAPAADQTNTIYYTRGKVKKPKQKGGGGNDYIGEMSVLGLEQLPIRVDPATIV